MKQAGFNVGLDMRAGLHPTFYTGIWNYQLMTTKQVV